MEASRPAGTGDVDRIVELARVMRAELAALRGGALWLEREAWPEPLHDAYRTLVDRNDAFLCVGTIDDAVLGFGAIVLERLRDGRTLGIITDLYVEAPAREVGIGEAIAEQLLEFSTTHGCFGIDAVALPGHRATKNFFEEQGFTARVDHAPR